MGLFDIFTKTSAERQAAKDAKNQRILEEEIINSAYAQDIDKQFNAVMRGADFECKERGNYTVWQPKLSETDSHTEYKQQDKSRGSQWNDVIRDFSDWESCYDL